MRADVEGLDGAALDWTPGPETSSIATLVIHSMGSEAEVLRVVRRLPSERVRQAEFERRVEDSAELLKQIDATAALLEESAAAITASDLGELRPRGDRRPRTGLYWLLRSLAHVREHLAHLELTKQLYEQRYEQPAGR
jgi:hypothetical protein